MPRKPSKIFILEGANEVGKSTLAAMLSQTLHQKHVPHVLLSSPGHETGTLGRHVYQIHENPAQFDVATMQAASLQVLHVAAHIDTLHSRIVPAINAGQIIILDRFWWSTWVYGRASGVAPKFLQSLIDLELLEWNRINPDCVFLIRRSKPFGAHANPESWTRLSKEYDKTAEREAWRQRVEVIANEGAAADAFAAIYSIVAKSIGKS